MAFAKKPAKTPEPEAKRRPEFVIRAKVKDGVWINIGAMWSAELPGGKPGWSIKINQAPLGWDGDALAMEPLPDKE